MSLLKSLLCLDISKSLDPVTRSLSVQEQGARRNKGMHEMGVQAAGHKTAKKLLLAGSRCTVLGQIHKEFKAHEIAVMTGSSLNHHRAATEHVSRAINHCMTRCKYTRLGSPVLPSPVHEMTLCCREKSTACPSSPRHFALPRRPWDQRGRAEQAVNPARDCKTTSLWDSRIRLTFEHHTN